MDACSPVSALQRKAFTRALKDTEGQDVHHTHVFLCKDIHLSARSSRHTGGLGDSLFYDPKSIKHISLMIVYRQSSRRFASLLLPRGRDSSSEGESLHLVTSYRKVASISLSEPEVSHSNPSKFSESATSFNCSPLIPFSKSQSSMVSSSVKLRVLLELTSGT